MQLKLFTYLIAALGKVASGPNAIANLPKAERAKINTNITALRDALIKEPQEFIRQELELYSLV